MDVNNSSDLINYYVPSNLALRDRKKQHDAVWGNQHLHVSEAAGNEGAQSEYWYT